MQKEAMTMYRRFANQLEDKTSANKQQLFTTRLLYPNKSLRCRHKGCIRIWPNRPLQMLITHNQHYELVEKGERLLSTYAHQLQSARMCSSREHIMLKCFEVAVPALKCQSAAAVENAHPLKLSPQMCPSSDFYSFRKKKKKRKVMSNPSSIITVCIARMR